ncbi:uncharacterized protein TNCV_2524521 [Trichonephila clavipes]|nr:uncharacterized protein TNCV_2524521 [Trichonephila clavipes]
MTQTSSTSIAEHQSKLDALMRITNKTSGEFIELFTKDVDENHNLTHFLESNKDFEFFCVKPKTVKPIKVIIKGLPIFTKTQEIHSDLQEEGFAVEKIFGYLQIRVEGFLVRGITQCYNCNNFYHTAENCHLKPRCLKCGKEHTTKQCPIKERQENPFCINCQEYGHSACYTKCPKFPRPKKGSPLLEIKNFNSNVRKEGVSFANVVSGVTFPSPFTPLENEIAKLIENNNSSKEIHGIEKDENY